MTITTIQNQMKNIRRYSELKNFTTFNERFKYLKLDGVVGEETFGVERYLNQMFYHSDEWKSIRNAVIVRDIGCDLGIEGLDIVKGIIVHHMNPITIRDIEEMNDFVIDPEFLICTSKDTHNAIHYGDEKLFLITNQTTDREPNDTCPWLKEGR